MQGRVCGNLISDEDRKLIDVLISHVISGCKNPGPTLSDTCKEIGEAAEALIIAAKSTDPYSIVEAIRTATSLQHARFEASCLPEIKSDQRQKPLVRKPNARKR